MLATLPSLEYLETPNKSERSTQDVRLVVVHDPEGSYEDAIERVKDRLAQVSYHVLTNDECTRAVQFVPWPQRAWSCVDFNSCSDNISIAGKAGNAWSYAALNRLARIIAFRLRERGLPPKFCSAPVSPDDPPLGFTFHSELGVAGGAHRDPGLTGVKKAFLLTSVKYQYMRNKFGSEGRIAPELGW